MSAICVRLASLTLLAALIAGSSVRGQDYFEQKKRDLAVQAQQTVVEVTAALEKSKNLEKASAAEAKTLLEKSLLSVNDASALDDKQRADLRGRLLARLKEVDATAREQKAKVEVASKAAADKAEREEKERQSQAKLQSQQKAPFDFANDRVSSAKKGVEAQNQVNRDKEKGFTNVSLGVLKSASKTEEERITAYFIAKSELRKTNKLSKEETALLKALDTRMDVNFNKNSFKEVLEYLGEKTGVNIFPDAGSLRDAQVDYDTQVTFKANKVTLRTVLKKILADLGLTYVIKEGNVQVIRPDRVKDYLVTRTYPVLDLIAPFDMRWGPVANRVQMNQQANGLIQLIVSTIDPTSWQGVDPQGYGTISFNPGTMSLIVRHTAEMHYMLGGGLGR